MLKIAKNLKLPDDAVTQTFAILAKRGVGKTYTASVMVEQLKKQMSATIEKAEAEDPKLLRRRIIELERQVNQKPAEPKVEIKEVPVITDKQIARLRKALEPAVEILKLIEPAMAPKINIKIDKPIPLKPQPAPIILPVEQKDSFEVIDGQPNLRAGERRILEVLARHYPLRFTRNQLGTISRFSPRGGTFGTYFGTLRRNGLIEETAGQVSITQAGLDYLGEVPTQPLTTDEVVNMWRTALRAGERKMLDVLIGYYPAAISRIELGQEAGFEPGGGTFGTYLGSLRRNGLIEVEGNEIRASDTLFAVGARQ